ncbi:MAG: AAA-like domain-containing protein [Nostoc sp. SerVER01]|nr:AAA-like domain-containing protein [Nostoc sp. SerVER01]MDZ8025407.1 AAA-like domain-containing protein [Nostoc sp. DedQUE11]
MDELAQRHRLNWNSQQANELIALVGGNPYLVQVALAQIKHHGITLEQLTQQAIAPDGIYSDL